MNANADAQASKSRNALSDLGATLGNHLVGLNSLIERLCVALLTGGHVLIEGPPGVAKTRTIKHFAQLLDISFVRIQATPDLLPSDMTGTEVFTQHSGQFNFMPGPLFNHIVLVDEINRAPPKVQSALLEAMGEKQISTSGTTRPLQEPFMVAATQNPIEHEGTYPLPEAQLDRFMFFIELALPTMQNERLILDQVLGESTINASRLDPVTTASAILQARQDIEKLFVSEAVRDYIVRIVGATRGEGKGATAASAIAHAASPRASINLAMAARALAWLRDREFATPDDVAELAPDILSGRIVLDYRARADGVTARAVVQDILEATPRI